MDMLPDYGYRLFSDENEAQEFAKHMSRNWSGTVTICGYATQEEILGYIEGIELDDITKANINNPNYYKSCL